MDCPAKLPPALLRNHCRNRSVSLKYSVDTPQHKDFFFFFLQPFIQSPLILREKEIIVSIIAYISNIFKYQTQFWCLEALCNLKLALVLQNNCWIILCFSFFLKQNKESFWNTCVLPQYHPWPALLSTDIARKRNSFQMVGFDVVADRNSCSFLPTYFADVGFLCSMLFVWDQVLAFFHHWFDLFIKKLQITRGKIWNCDSSLVKGFDGSWIISQSSWISLDCFIPLISWSWIHLQSFVIFCLRINNAQCAFWVLRWPCGQKLKSKNTLSDGKKYFWGHFSYVVLGRKL